MRPVLCYGSINAVVLLVESKLSEHDFNPQRGAHIVIRILFPLGERYGSAAQSSPAYLTMPSPIPPQKSLSVQARNRPTVTMQERQVPSNTQYLDSHRASNAHNGIQSPIFQGEYRLARRHTVAVRIGGIADVYVDIMMNVSCLGQLTIMRVPDGRLGFCPTPPHGPAHLS